MSETIELDEELLEALDSLPEVSLDDLRVGAFAYKVGVLILKKEYPQLVEDDEGEGETAAP